jgi:tRNA(Ile)-lysidine synthase
VTRREILAFLQEGAVEFLTDPTNEDGSNLRGRLRRDVIPGLLRENPEWSRVLGRTATLLEDFDDFVRAEAARAVVGLRRPGSAGEMVLDGPSGRPYHRIVLSTILRNAMHGVNPSAEAGFESLDRLVRAWKSGGTEAVDLKGGVRISVDRDRVAIMRRDTDPAGPRSDRDGFAERVLPVPGAVALAPWEAALEAVEVTPAPRDARDSSDTVAWLDAQRVRSPLRVRTRRPGDRYRPLGLAGSAKVQDLMVDRKIPRRWRDVVPVVADADGILWIPGFRVDERTRISERTRTALCLRVAGHLPWLTEAMDE